MRCFIAITLPEGIKKGLSAIQIRLKAAGADVSWTRPEAMHLTLKFLGDVNEDMVPEIKSCLGRCAAGSAPFTLEMSGAGIFPDVRRPRIIWSGIREKEDRLDRLQREIEQEMARIGFPEEGRRFSPHITLGRIRSPKNREKLLDLIDSEKDIELDGFEVLNIHLVQSELRPEGAVYTELFTGVLKGDEHG